MARTRQKPAQLRPDRATDRACGGAVAQLGERRNRTAEVRGSNPLGSTSLRSLSELRLGKYPGMFSLAPSSYSRPNALIHGLGAGSQRACDRSPFDNWRL